MHANVGVRSLRDDSCENLLHVFFSFFSPWLKWLAVIILLIFFERIMEVDTGAHNANKTKIYRTQTHANETGNIQRVKEMETAYETKYCTNLDVCIQILYSYNEAKRKLVQLLCEFEMKQVNL